MGTAPKEREALIPVKARRPRLRWLRYTALAVVTVLVVAIAGSYAFVRKSLPQISVELQLAGLTAPVSVYRDDWGVPHIEAQSYRDVFMAQGYVTAQDRLWQMDLTRRAAAGRLSEVMGASQVNTDKFFRALQLTRAAEQSIVAYSPWAKELIDAYSAGVNAYIDQATAAGRLPVEFAILGYQPEHWTALDSALIGKIMAYDLGGNWSAEVYRYQLRQKVDETLFRELLPVYPNSGITIMRQTAEAGAAAPQVAALPPAGGGIDLDGLLSTAIIPDEWVGSNNWVVSGKLTQSGKPLLADDPHLGLRTPAIWYNTHLVVNNPQEPLNVYGATFPGGPGIVLGHTDKIAWGVTNTGPDVQDLYIEKRNPENPNQFEYKGKWEDAKIYQEPIKVKGKPDVPFEVVVTRHGPIISEVAGSEKNRPEEALSLRWTANLATIELEAVIGMNRATNWTEFRHALKGFMVPTQNFVFASQDGTIAYKAAGVVPIRAKEHDGLLPVPGWTGEYEWQGYISFDNMPEVVNPAAGFIATANNKVVDSAYPYHLSHSWAQPYRAQRIVDVLSSKPALTADDMRLLQTDYMNLQAKSLLPILMPLVEKAQLSAQQSQALALLKGWDYVDAADQGAPLLYHLWWKHLTRELYEPGMGEDLYKRMADTGNITDEMIRQAGEGAESSWLKIAGGLEQLAAKSFKLAVDEAVKLQGKNPQKWAWGQYHRIGPVHPIGGSVKPLGWLMNAKALPVGGSSVTVGAMSFNRQTGMVSHSAPWRQVVDLADIGGAGHVLTPGQSGHFLSKWYEDGAALHAEGGLRPALLEQQAYQQGTKLLLKP